MSLQPLPGFQSLTTYHCCTGSMRHVYVYNGHPLSEDMLLGIGGGVGFIYWHTKGTVPLIGGRGKGRPSQGFERCTGERTGVLVQDYATSSVKKAEASLLDILYQGQPVMLQLDMGYLPYFNFGGQEYHFGAHFIVVCGYDAPSRTVLIADRDEELHPVPMDVLVQARGSSCPPFVPNNRWFTFDFTHKRQPTPQEVREALREMTEGMVDPPISNMGVQGIRKASQRSRKWPEEMDEELLRFTMFNSYIFIDAEGGTGGGIFRYMFSRFLREAAEIIEEPRLNGCADKIKTIGDHWQEVAGIFKQGWKAEDPAEVLPETSQRMMEIAELEEDAWRDILALT
jgi:hypothetical protein